MAMIRPDTVTSMIIMTIYSNIHSHNDHKEPSPWPFVAGISARYGGVQACGVSKIPVTKYVVQYTLNTGQPYLLPFTFISSLN